MTAIKLNKDTLIHGWLQLQQRKVKYRLYRDASDVSGNGINMCHCQQRPMWRLEGYLLDRWVIGSEM